MPRERNLLHTQEVTGPTTEKLRLGCLLGHSPMVVASTNELPKCDCRSETYRVAAPGDQQVPDGVHEPLSLKRRSISSSRKFLTNVFAARGGIACVWFTGHGKRERRERPGRRGVDPYTVARNQAHFSASVRPRAAIHPSACGPSSRSASSKVCRRFQAAEPRANRSRARAR